MVAEKTRSHNDGVITPYEARLGLLEKFFSQKRFRQIPLRTNEDILHLVLFTRTHLEVIKHRASRII